MKKEIKNFLLICPLALLSLLVPAFFDSKQLLASILLVLLGMLMLGVEWNYPNFILYILVLISGPASEAISLHFGASWVYVHPVFFGVPIWLPFLWGNAGIFIIRLKDVIISLRKNNKNLIP